MSHPLSSIGPRLGRRLPKGWTDVGLQLGLFTIAYAGYQMVRGIADGKRELALANADRVIDLERSLGSFFEPAVQRALIDQQWLIDAANWMYLNTQFVITSAFLVWLYLLRNNHFYFVRNMFMVAMALGLVGYICFPTAPPRFIEDAGFVDTVAAFTSVDQDSAFLSLLVNPYAAVPSMHIAFAVIVGAVGAVLARGAPLRFLWAVYPLLVFFVIVVTANHYWFDAAAGAAVAVAAALVAHRLLAPVRPRSWSWRTAPGEAAA